MARFRLMAAMQVGHFHYRIGTTLADSNANALPGDKVWTGMSAANLIPDMVPLDASATTMLAASRWAGIPVRTWTTGVESVDA
jgi:hypothetical protein